MLDGRPLIDVHLHPARRPTVKLAWDQWATDFGAIDQVNSLYDADGTVVPARFDALLAGEGVDVAMVLSEYSPRVTGIQAIEDMVPLAAHNPGRIKIAANINPHLHYPVEDELQRQLGLGAIALKIHPVHAGIAANDRSLYPAYAICQDAGLPVVVHCGTSTFPGASNTFADPVVLDDVLRDFRRLNLVLAHGGRGWWYDAAAFMALSSDRVWIELSGLPPSRLREYYARHHWGRLTRRMIFATDWPGIPGIARNARAVAALCPDEEIAGLVLAGHASQVYHLELPRLQTRREPGTGFSGRPGKRSGRTIRQLLVAWANSFPSALASRAVASAVRRPRFSTLPSHTSRPVVEVIGRMNRTDRSSEV